MPRSGLPEPHEAHVWHVRVDLQKHVDATLLDRLHPDEQERAGRHRPGGPRERYATARAALRGILGRYADCPPDAVVLRTEASGKPTLLNTDDIHFSVSHARDGALVAVCRIPVGVDVEHVREPHRLERTAARVLHEDTVALLARLPAGRRVLTFFDAWTQREAHVKAMGGGLFRTPDTLPFQPDLEPAAIRTVTDRADGAAWSIARLVCAPDMRAALAARGRIERIINLQWDGDRS